MGKKGSIDQRRNRGKEREKRRKKQYSTVLISLNAIVGLLISPEVKHIEQPAFGKMKAERLWWKACTQIDIEPGLSGSVCTSG